MDGIIALFTFLVVATIGISLRAYYVYLMKKGLAGRNR